MLAPYLLALMIAAPPPEPGFAIHEGRFENGRILWRTVAGYPMTADLSHTTFELFVGSEGTTWQVTERETTMPLALGAGRVDLGAPLLAGVRQLVLLELPEDLIFQPDEKLGLEKHIGGDLTEKSFSARDRSRLEYAEAGLLGKKRPRTRVFLLGDGGLAGELISAASKMRMAAFCVLGLFLLAVGGLGAGYKKLATAAERERADALLAAEIDSLP